MQGGLGAASSNGVATMLGLERALRKLLPERNGCAIASQVGSDLPLFVVGGTVLGVGRGEEVYPLPDLADVPMVIVTPEIGVSTPKGVCGLGCRLRKTKRKRSRRSAPQREQIALTHLGRPIDCMRLAACFLWRG